MVSPTYSWRLAHHALELDVNGHHDIDDMEDVDLTVPPATDDVLIYNGTNWVAGVVVSAAAHIADAVDAHDASAISIADAGLYYAGTTVEDALQEIGAGGIGGGGGGGVELTPEIPAGTIDGVNDDFTLSVTPDALILFKNGLLQREGSGEDYTITTNVITYEAGNEPQVGDTHVAYIGTATDILSHITSEMDATLVLAPDGAGGVEFRAEAGGGGIGLPLNYFGTGQDGSTTINSGAFTLVLGSGETLINANVLTRDAYFDDLTLNGGDLDTNGFRLFVQGTLTMTSGVIRNNANNGGNGGNGTGAAGGAAGATALSTSTGTLGIASNASAAGQIGGFNANGINNTTVATASTHGHTASVAGAAGGASGAGQTGGTGSAASVSVFTASERIAGFVAIYSGRTLAGASFGAPSWAVVVGQPGGGGSGAGSPASGGGGSGGSGGNGGPVVVNAYEIVGTTDIQSLGGTGGTGGNGGGTNAGGGAGGNGGNGGVVLFTTHDMTGWSGSLDASGGAPGNGGAGIGTGSNGGNGNGGIAGVTYSQVV